MLLFQLFVLLMIKWTKAATDKLLVKYLEETVIRSKAAAYIYEPPDNAYEYKPTNQTLTDYGTFDYIIVGAGSAGAVLATRLSENQNITILLVEAGGRATTFVNMAGMLGYLQKTKFNWNFHTVPQTSCCLGMVKHQCFHPRGKGLGGSTLINVMVYTRGNRYDYDSWGTAGNYGWSYNDVLQYFEKSENFEADGDCGYHGKGGLLNVKYTKPADELISYQFIKANQEVGRKILDYNGEQDLGISVSQQTVLNGDRQHTAKAFLEKAENRPNLNILTNSYATKVEIDAEKRARGIRFDHENNSFRAYASREVILSAGVIGSPQLLLLSGVGPSEHLNRLKIPVVKNLPVGQNFQDQITFWGLYFKTNYTAPLRTLTQNVRDFIKGSGPFTVGGGVALGYLRTESSRTPKDVPNIQVFLEPINRPNDFKQKIFNYDNETFQTFWSGIDPRTTFRVAVILLKPQSRGSVRLKSSCPYEYPLIDPKYLSDPNNEDIQALYEGIAEMLELLKTKAFGQLDAKLYYKVLPNCRGFSYFSKEQWFCQIRHLSSQVHHTVGTCKMALFSNGGVVDSQLRVRGIDNLRVVDASIFPDAISGHAPAIMLAEKAAVMLCEK